MNARGVRARLDATAPDADGVAMLATLMEELTRARQLGEMLQKRTLEKRRAPASAAEDEDRGNLRRGSWSDWRLRKRRLLPQRT
jgi:hypothetical protein